MIEAGWIAIQSGSRARKPYIMLDQSNTVHREFTWYAFHHNTWSQVRGRATWLNGAVRVRQVRSQVSMASKLGRNGLLHIVHVPRIVTHTC